LRQHDSAVPAHFIYPLLIRRDLYACTRTAPCTTSNASCSATTRHHIPLTNTNQNALSMTSPSTTHTGTKFSTKTLINYISSIKRDIRVFAPQTFLQPPSPKYFNVGKAFLYQLMLSAVGMWPEAPPGALTVRVPPHPRYFALLNHV
jgi:hypothetical protein